MKALAHLILIKHAMPQISPVVASPLWPLSEQGRYQCCALADTLTGYALQGIVTSTEPKAQETAAILASQLGLDYKRNAENPVSLDRGVSRNCSWSSRK